MASRSRHTYYLIGPFDTIYGRFCRLPDAKACLAEMSLNNCARIKELQPCIYRSCDKPFDEYVDGEILRYVEADRIWTHLVFSWDSFVRVKHRLYSKGMHDYLQDENGEWAY